MGMVGSLLKMRVLHKLNLRDLGASLPLGSGPRSLRSLAHIPAIPTNFPSSKPSFPWCYGPEFVAKQLRKWRDEDGPATHFVVLPSQTEVVSNHRAGLAALAGECAHESARGAVRGSRGRKTTQYQRTR